MQKCILFAGPVGCSKTPVAHHLSWNLGLPIFSTDAIRTEVLENALNPTWMLDNDLQLKIRKERLAKLINSKKDFILDGSIDRTWQDLKPEFKKNNYNYFIISFDLSLDLLIKLFKAKGYQEIKMLKDSWYPEHQKFLSNYKNEVNLSINDNNFKDRLEKCFKEAKKFMMS